MNSSEKSNQGFVEAERPHGLSVARTYQKRIQSMGESPERAAIVQEWHDAYAAFSPEQKAETQPFLDEILDSGMKIIAEMDAIVANFKQKHPDLAPLFDEK